MARGDDSYDPLLHDPSASNGGSAPLPGRWPQTPDWSQLKEGAAMKRAIGMVRLSIASAEHRQGNIGFSMDGAIRGQGYASEAMRALLDYGFQTLGLHRITALADVENARSHVVLEKLGFRREGRLAQNFHVRGEWRDSDLFALLRAEWQPGGMAATLTA